MESDPDLFQRITYRGGMEGRKEERGSRKKEEVEGGEEGGR
jgi:hypothetical protein